MLAYVWLCLATRSFAVQCLVALGCVLQCQVV